MDLAKPKTAFAVVLQVPARHSPCQVGERGPCGPLTMAEWVNSCLVVAQSVALIVNAGCIQSQLIRISLFLEGQFSDIQT